MLHRIATLAIAAPRRILGLAALVMIGAGVFGVPVADHLSAGGFDDPSSQSSRATAVLRDTFHQSDQQLLFSVTAPEGTTSTAARTAATHIVDGLHASPHVLSVTSAWSAPASAASALVSRDGKTGLIVADLAGGENKAQKYAKQLADELTVDQEGVTVRAGGSAMVYSQVNDQSERDLVRMESIAVPLSFVVLVWVFGGLLAAAVPAIVGMFAILGTLSVLRLITYATDVSIYALNLTTAMGLALAIDYTLLIISRYREELAEGTVRELALVRTMVTAGRTVLFSATTVALSMSAMVLFPMYFLKSFAYAGVATVAFAATSAIVLTPAAIVLLGDRLSALDARRLLRRVLRRPEPERRQAHQLFWYRSTRFVMRRSVPIGLAVVALLLLVGAPFLGVRWGYPDDRVLPVSASSRQVGDELRNDFVDDTEKALQVVITGATNLNPHQLSHYATALSQVPDVSDVSAPSGTYVGGRLVGPPTGPTGMSGDSAYLTVNSVVALYSDDSENQLDALHAVSPPGRWTVEFAGLAQVNRDSVHSIISRIPWVLGLIAVITFGLLFLLTGSVVLPVKAVILNVLSLTATFGALVWIFQEGHLGALGTTSTGTIVANIPILLFCIAFGLSMDYEVFLVSRIREYWLELGQDTSATNSQAANDESVALGLAYTGRVITAAALIMAISFAALTAAEVSFMRMFGLGLTIAVLVDATVVRMVLVPAFMHLMGKWNWWAPPPLVRLHQRIGISESGG
ncbi:MMPL family transporter [Mycobacterium spongiae]|uniref:MMPL family transporter n=1 Tax=Mycobacterium spongiae TaxID=886343 RepID=A0A975JUR0_9MYCO|nr:MMPL family transporter [Mycobacterium spongiae]QUR66062.1 MMPL family transporter [Mycobacterium spongiae]